MPARNNSAYVVADLTRDTGFASATVHIDPTKWSSRRRNIVLRALNDGLTACGQETAYFIDCLTQAYGGRVQTMTKWNTHITVDCVKEEEVDNLIAYTCAWIRLAVGLMVHRLQPGQLVAETCPSWRTSEHHTSARHQQRREGSVREAVPEGRRRNQDASSITRSHDRAG